VSEVIVVVIMQAKPGAGSALKELMVASVPDTHRETGCLTYALHTALDAHFQQPYLRKLFADVEHVLAEPPITAVCSALPAGDPVKGVLA
jgi:quinol monooxygenase YgiN